VSVERVGSEAEVVAHRRTIVTALPLQRAARDRLAELLDARVLDVRDPCDRADLVLTPVCSPQLIGALRDRYQGARVIVVELEDWELGIELPGPVKRIVRAGAAAYVLADSIDALAAKITSQPDAVDAAPAAVHELATSSTVDDIIAAFLRESVEYSTRHGAHGA
jgi:hypothetical protein